MQQATVAGAGVESVGSDRVEVLLFMNMSTVRTLPGEKEPRQQVSQNRASFVMVKKDSRWLVAELSTLLGSPSEILSRRGDVTQLLAKTSVWDACAGGTSAMAVSIVGRTSASVRSAV